MFPSYPNKRLYQPPPPTVPPTPLPLSSTFPLSVAALDPPLATTIAPLLVAFLPPLAPTFAPLPPALPTSAGRVLVAVVELFGPPLLSCLQHH